MKKDFGIIGGLFLLVILLLTVGNGFSSFTFVNKQSTSSSSIGFDVFNQKQMIVTPVTIGDLLVDAEVAATPDTRKQGLSDRESMPINRGMLFVFDSPSIWGIWMKSMKFPIDIIWADENKKIVYIVQNASPEPGKSDNELTIYKPGTNALYVLEINAGLANLHNLKVGNTINFNLNPPPAPGH